MVRMIFLGIASVSGRVKAAQPLTISLLFKRNRDQLSSGEGEGTIAVLDPSPVEAPRRTQIKGLILPEKGVFSGLFWSLIEKNR
jgi:hypothetical protein